MPAQASESFVLRTYPLREADLIVSFFTRDLGKLRGVARRARKPKNSFGSGLERLSQVKMFYFTRENRELVSLDSCELIQSQFGIADYAGLMALDFICGDFGESPAAVGAGRAVLPVAGSGAGVPPGESGGSLACRELLQPLGCQAVGVLTGASRRAGVAVDCRRNDAQTYRTIERA